MDEGGTLDLIRLACIILILALEIIGVTLAEDAADEAMVDNGTMGLTTIVQGSIFASDQSVTGTGFASVYKDLAIMDPSDGSQVFDLKNIASGTGAYNHESYIYLQNNTLIDNAGDFSSADHNITARDDTTAVYSPVSYEFPGSFNAKAIKSLWRDQTYTKNYANMVSMDSLFDYARTLKTESTTTMYSNYHKYKDIDGMVNSTAWSTMNINSQFDGSAHIGVSLDDVRGGIGGIVKTKANSTVLMDEDYRGSFNLTKKMTVNMVKTTNYGDYDTNYDGYDGDYPWLPCACNAGAGWGDMVIHDQRYHSAKGFFDCTTCWPPGPCKN